MERREGILDQRHVEEVHRPVPGTAHRRGHLQVLMVDFLLRLLRVIVVVVIVFPAHRCWFQFVFAPSIPFSSFLATRRTSSVCTKTRLVWCLENKTIASNNVASW
jgi:hypothetical protein